MADDEREKAEKLAAAKKRFEQLKKEQQKKGKKGGAKKKGDKADGGAEAKVDDADIALANEEDKSAEVEETGVDGGVEEAAAEAPLSSEPLQSKARSESFRQGAGPTSPSAEVQELYRKQASRIEELEKENKFFHDQHDESASRLAKAEEELDSLREGSSNLAELKSKSKDAERLQTELASTQRQLTQAQQAAKGAGRRMTATSPDVSEQLASKTSTIESLELEISNLRHQTNVLQSTISERETSVKELEERLKTADSATDSAKQELDALKVSIAFPSDETKAANENPEALIKRITVLESDLRTANTNLEAAGTRATTLSQKIEALTKLHRDATATSQHKDKELSDLQAQVRRREKASHVRDASEFELGDDETELGGLQARIRALEAENFDLQRGIWRDKRTELQPGMNDAGSPEYEDIDLDGPYGSAQNRQQRGSLPRHSSTFQDVIASGISAFTGQSRYGHEGSAPVHARKQSLGLLSEDGDFDPEAFRLAQEEEGKRRIERIKETKRGLEKWKGWRIDLVSVREASPHIGRDMGPAFEV